MNTLDYILLGIIGVLALWGFIKGFLSTVIGLGGYVVAIVTARIWGQTVGEFFKNTGMIESLQRAINSNLANIGVNGMDPQATSTILNDPQIGSVIANNPIYKSLFENQAALASGTEGVTSLLINIVCTSLGYLLVFLAVKIIISLVGALISGVVKSSKSIGFLDRFLGLIVGSATGVALSALTVTFVMPILMTYSSGIYEVVQNSMISGILLNIANIFI